MLYESEHITTVHQGEEIVEEKRKTDVQHASVAEVLKPKTKIMTETHVSMLAIQPNPKESLEHTISED